MPDLETQLKEAREFGEKVCKAYNDLLAQSKVVTCVYCGYAYSEGTPATQNSLLNAHIRICPKHPFAKSLVLLRRMKAWSDLVEAAGPVAAESVKDMVMKDVTAFLKEHG
jgi:hypothetical protein